MFAKFFKPKWQHSKAEVRVRAINSMNADDSNHVEILSQLALQDLSPAVRQAAVEKIAVPELLYRISTNDSDLKTRRSAADRICRLILDTEFTTAAQRITSINHLSDDKMLTHIVIHSPDPASQKAALERISDQLCLRTIVLNANNNLLRKTAAEKLTQTELLEQLSKQTRNKDKTVNRIIRDKLRLLRETAKQAELISQRQQELINSFEHLSDTDYFAQYPAKLDALCQEWIKVTRNQPSEQQEQADALIKQCTATIQQQQQRDAESVLQRQQLEEKRAQQAAILEQCKQQLSQCEKLLADSEAFSPEAIESQLSCWQTIQRRWLELTSDSPADLQKRYRTIEQSFTAITNSAVKFFDAQDDLASLLNKSSGNGNKKNLAGDIKRIDRLLAKIAWPTTIQPPELLQQLTQLKTELVEQLDQFTNQKQAINSQLTKLIVQLESAIEQGEIKSANRIDQQIANMLNELNGKTSKASLQRYKTLHAQLAELKDWQGYAVTPKKEQLCEVMEALTSSELSSPELAKRIHQLQQEWKELDATDPFHSHALWKRFKAASDAAYQPCESYFAEQKQLRADNLSKRKVLCSQLEQFVTDTDWQNPDWKQVELISRTAKQEWRDYAPVDRTPGKEIQSSFNALLKHLDGQLKAYRGQNAELKQALVDQAKNISQEEDQQIALNRIKDLQRQWKDIGSSFHSVERKLWPLFREYCNQAFTHYDQQARTDQNNQHKLLSLCEQLEAVQAKPTPLKQMLQLLGEAEQAYEELDTPGQDNTEQRFNKACEFIRQQKLRFDNLIQSDQFQALQRKVMLCEHLESMLLSGVIEEDKLNQVVQSWLQGLQPSAPYDELIEQRYQTTLLLLEQDHETSQVMYDSEQRLRQLCIRLEIALGLPSPEADQAIRMEYQMQRLQQAIEQRDKTPLPVDLKAMELEWMCVPFSQQHEALYPRFHDTLKQVL
ncbi:MAG: DUF349 domain-containing protein [Amphritea sp.]